ncbi:HD domain-containing protein [Nitrolancea hollandica]|uniref:Putative exopolyphosphatase n=1 Tax=Nitrolancea hollandica Lb TaxID=1129897 RepID=I4ECB2_9BACT|nr:HD domain-containing protein [Nitrolancea hollandica]CCF82324.1 putative exopolyphosphatase [Nitrolancea hollandica Lb]
MGGIAAEGQGDSAIIRATAENIAIPDLEHSLQVARLSLQLHDQLRDTLHLSPESRDLLAAAALWHDVGQFRNLPEHHKQSFEIIVAQLLKGYSRLEQLQIANIARYHRRAHPSREHPGYRNLPRRLRPDVDRMSALLRIAEGLDAGHLGVVRDLQCEIHPGYITVRVRAQSYPMLEIERAQERAGLFREVFNRDIEFAASVERGDAQANDRRHERE